MVNSGLNLTIANPITGTGALTNLGAGVSGFEPHQFGFEHAGHKYLHRAAVVTATLQSGGGTLLVNGTHTVATGTTGAYSINSGGTLGGNGLIDLSAVNLGVTIGSGSMLSPGAAANTAGTLTFNLGTGILDISGAITPANASALLFDLGAVNASDEVVLTSGTLNIGSGLLNLGSFAFNPLAGIQPGTYTLFQAPTITGTLGSKVTGVVGGYNAALSLSGGTLLLTLSIPLAASSGFQQSHPQPDHSTGSIGCFHYFDRQCGCQWRNLSPSRRIWHRQRHDQRSNRHGHLHGRGGRLLHHL